MSIYKIKDKAGKVINTIQADLKFVEEHHKGLYEEVPEPEPVETVKIDVEPTQTVAEQVAVLSAKIDAMNLQLSKLAMR